MKIRDIASALGADVETAGGMAGSAGEIEISGVAKIEEARQGDITFLANPKYGKFLGTTLASAVIIGKSVRDVAGGKAPVYLRVDDPYASFLKVLLLFHPPGEPLPPGIHPTAAIDPGAAIGKDVRIGAHAVVNGGCRIADRAVILHGVVLGKNVEIGEGTLIYPNVSVYEGCRIGARVIVHAGTVIGSDGFGFAPRPDDTYEKIPQLGIVVVEDDVEIGANCTIDRATLGETVIRRGAKLDNLIQVGHNVVIGENTVIAAQAGISGSTKIGRNNMIGGQVGFTGHLEIADNTKFGAQSGVHKSVPAPGGTFLGYPAVPQREALRIMNSMGELPELLITVRALKEKIAQLERELARRHPSPRRKATRAARPRR